MAARITWDIPTKEGAVTVLSEGKKVVDFYDYDEYEGEALFTLNLTVSLKDGYRVMYSEASGVGDLWRGHDYITSIYLPSGVPEAVKA